MSGNPYQPIDAAAEQAPGERRRRYWTLWGACVAGIPPEAMGAYGWYQFNAYLKTLPAGEATCGTPMLGPLMLIVFVGPICGLIGGICGGLASNIRWQNNR